MRLTLRQLEIFLAVAEDGSFRRTAERLGISQPSVSGRIKSLETFLGYELFDRLRGGNARLTPEGRAFVARARRLLNNTSGVPLPRAPAVNSPPRLKVLIGPLLLKHRVMPELAAFCEENPNLQADFLLATSAMDGSELIRSGEADIFFYTGDPPEPGEMDVEVIGRTACSIYGTPELLTRIGMTVDSMAPFILPPEHYPAATWIRNRLAKIGIRPANIVVRPQFPDVIVRMIREGRGLSVFFDEFIGAGLQKIGPPLAPASRVMLIGPRARHETALPVLNFLRRVGAVPERMTCQ